MKSPTKTTRITCTRCGKVTPPAFFKAIFCSSCTQYLEEEEDRRAAASRLNPVPVPAGFRRNDYRGDI